MPDRPDLDTVRAELRRHDRAEESPSSGVSDMADGVTVMQLASVGEDRFQLLRRELGISAFGLNLIRLRPGQRGRIHLHERQEEVYVVLEGTLTLEIEGSETHELGAGGIARVAPPVRRQLSNRGASPVAVLAIGGSEPHEGRDGRAFRSWDDHEGAAPRDIPLPEDVEHA
jgi:mannose-6-phosphate isomerase-like protein (cupin superfamily)